MVEFHRAAEEVARIEPAGDQVGVRQRWLGPAPRVTGWARVGPGALRADVQAPCRINPCQRAAAGANLHYLDSWRLHRVSGEGRRLADVVQRVHSHLAISDR